MRQFSLSADHIGAQTLKFWEMSQQKISIHFKRYCSRIFRQIDREKLGTTSEATNFSFCQIGLFRKVHYKKVNCVVFWRSFQMLIHFWITLWLLQRNVTYKVELRSMKVQGTKKTQIPYKYLLPPFNVTCYFTPLKEVQWCLPRFDIPVSPLTFCKLQCSPSCSY